MFIGDPLNTACPRTVEKLTKALLSFTQAPVLKLTLHNSPR